MSDHTVFIPTEQKLPTSGDSGDAKAKYDAALQTLEDAKEACAKASFGKHYDVFDLLMANLGTDQTHAAKGLVFKTTQPAQDEGVLASRMPR